MTGTEVAVAVPEAARRLSMSESTVWRLIRKGELPVLAGTVRRTLVPVAALEERAARTVTR